MSWVITLLASGLRWALIIGVPAALLAFLGAPSLFGVVLITAGVVSTVLMWTFIGFVIGTIKQAFMGRKTAANGDGN